MKNKKSKIVAPALGLILLSTAASISGSVAWFTANRTAKFNASEFAVVNTKGNLQFELGAGLGTQIIDGVNGKEVANIASKTLTDASFDHISNDHYIFAPDATGTQVGKKVALGSATFDNNATTGIQRDNENIFSAFTWTIDFKLSIPSSATQDIGLFFSANEAKMVKKVTLPAGTIVPASTYYTSPDLDPETAVTAGELNANKECYTQTTTAPAEKVHFDAGVAIPADTYYTTSECTALHEGRGAEGDAIDVYRKNKASAVDTGTGFRIAIVGTTATYTTTRVWSDLQTNSNAKHVLAAAEVDNPFDDGDENPSNDIIASYDSPALIDSALNSDPETTLTGARSVFTSSPLYLGYFDKAQAGNTVTLSYTFVAWFEGTDPNVVNNPDTVYDTMASYLAFETVNLPNA